MHKPYLIDGYKFDLRIYVLLAGVNPMRVFLYKEGLARFATVPYESPQPSNLDNLFMHLTNYAINKDSENFVANTSDTADDVGSKRSLTSVLRNITATFGETRCRQVWADIRDLIIKTLCIAQPILQHLYRQCQPDDLDNSLCSQVLGFDVMIDHALKPSLLEVNQSPSFTTDSPLDLKIKKALITDTLKLWNLSLKKKVKAKTDKRNQMQKRLLNYQGPSTGN
jgi:tubulin polyglutamylase TTLL6/13